MLTAQHEREVLSGYALGGSPSELPRQVQQRGRRAAQFRRACVVQSGTSLQNCMQQAAGCVQ